MTDKPNGKIIGQLGSQKSPLIIKLDEFQGRRILDVRRYFMDKNKNGLQPTKKGLTITAGVFNFLEEIAYQYCQEIRSWLEEPANNKGQELIARSKATENSRFDYQDYEVELDEWKSDSFFHIKTEGALNVITFNQRHSYIASIIKNKNSDDMLKNIAMIIVAFKRASYRFDDLDFNYPALFDSLEYEWGALLKSYDQGR